MCLFLSSVFFSFNVSQCVFLPSRPAVWLKARPWEAAGWHQGTNCTHNNVGFHVNGQPLWSCHRVDPSPPGSWIIIAFGGLSNHVVRLALTSTLTAKYLFHTDFLLFSICLSFCVPLPFSSPLFPSLPVHFSSSFSFSNACFSWQVKTHDGGLVSVTLHIFPSPLASSPCLRSILGRWLCVLSSLKALLSRGVELIDVPFPHLYITASECVTDYVYVCAFFFFCLIVQSPLCICKGAPLYVLPPLWVHTWVVILYIYMCGVSLIIACVSWFRKTWHGC